MKVGELMTCARKLDEKEGAKRPTVQPRWMDIGQVQNGKGRFLSWKSRV